MNLIKLSTLGICLLFSHFTHAQEPFRTACQGDINKLDSLLSDSISINILDGRGRTLLHYAVSCEKQEVFQYLIKQGIDINHEDNSGMSPLLLALKRNRHVFTEKLMALNASANYNHANGEGTTILMQAILDDNRVLAELLIENGADVNIMNERGNTPLGIAKREGLDGMAKLLTANGATIVGAQVLEPAGKYLGSSEPGLSAELFASNFISTENFVHNGFFHPNGKEFYFTIETKRYHRGTIMVSKIIDGKWSTPEPAPIPGDYREVGPFISADGQKFYYASNRPIDESDAIDHGMDIWMMERDGKSWGSPVHLGNDLNTKGSDWFPTLSTDGTLYYYTHLGRSGNIYYAESQDGQYGEGILIDNVGNGDYYNYDPLIAPDESYLIFATTNRPDGLGRADLYISFKDDENNWTTPKNMGTAINSSESEYAPQLSHDGKYLLFTRGFGDIYWVSSTVIENLK